MKIVRIIQNGTDSAKELAALYCGAVTICALAFAHFEHVTVLKAYWWAFVTALTIGYGDIYPHTIGGMIFGVILMHVVTLFIIPIIIARMASRVIHNKDQFTHEEQQEIKRLLRALAKKEGIQ